MKSKKDIRQSIYEKRKTLSDDYYKEATEMIHQNLFSLDVYQEAKTIYLFASMPKELDTTQIIEHAHANGKRVALPRTIKLGEMDFHQYIPGDPLIRSTFGADEPREDAPIIPLEEADLIVMPCVTCNDKGERLGYGGGFYDRILDHYEGMTVLPYFAELQTLDIPMEEHDRKMNYVITERSIVKVLL